MHKMKLVYRGAVENTMFSYFPKYSVGVAVYISVYKYSNKWKLKLGTYIWHRYRPGLLNCQKLLCSLGNQRKRNRTRKNKRCLTFLQWAKGPCLISIAYRPDLTINVGFQALFYTSKRLELWGLGLWCRTLWHVDHIVVEQYMSASIKSITHWEESGGNHMYGGFHEEIHSRNQTLRVFSNQPNLGFGLSWVLNIKPRWGFPINPDTQFVRF